MGLTFSIKAVSDLLNKQGSDDEETMKTVMRVSMYQWLFEECYSVVSTLISFDQTITRNNKPKSGDDINHWIIDGKVYDLRPFLDWHPGGKHMLLMNRGRDCTELFFMYHLPSKYNITYMQSQLKKYYICDASSNQILSPFVWSGKNYEIYLDFQSQIQSYFKNKRKISGTYSNRDKASLVRIIWGLFLFISLFYVYKYWLIGYWFTIPFLSLIHWLLSSALLHNGTHYQLVSNANINQLLSLIGGFFHAPNIQWEMQHVISHHSYTNINGLDIDLNHFLDNFRTNSKQKHVEIYEKWRYFMPIYILMTSIGQIDAWTGRIERHIHRLMVPFWSREGGRYISTYVLNVYLLQVIWIFFLLPFAAMYYHGVFKGILFYLLPRVGHGALFYIFSQVTHIQSEAFDKKSDFSDSWIRHQVQTSVDYSVCSTFWNFMSIGLNNQALHHLLPSLHPCHNVALQPVLNAFCTKYNMQRHVHSNIFIALFNHFKYIAQINDIQ